MEPKHTELSIPLQPLEQGATPANLGPPDYVLWSLFNVLVGYSFAYIGCCCFPALIFSIKARDCKVQGDLEGAQRHGNRAKVLNIIFTTLILVSVVSVISVITIVVLRLKA